MKYKEESRQSFTQEHSTITEFVFTVKGIKIPIKGRITETPEKDGPFYWEVSHEYSPVLGQPIHSPSARTGQSFHEAYEIMTGYLANMCSPLRKNKNYSKKKNIPD